MFIHILVIYVHISKVCFRCRVCGGKFSSLLSKNRHILREHQSTNKANKLIKAATKPETKTSPEPGWFYCLIFYI